MPLGVKMAETISQTPGYCITYSLLSVSLSLSGIILLSPDSPQIALFFEN